MSIEDDLLKLSELKEKGTITTEEFEARKAQLLKPPAKRLNMTGLWWKLPAAVIGVSGMIYSSNAIKRTKTVTTDELPSCQSENATSALREAFNQSQVARTENLGVIEIQNATEIQPSTKERRSCAATITLNNTSKIDVAFVLEKRTSGKFMLTFEVRDAEDGSGVSGSTAQPSATPTSRPHSAEQAVVPAKPANSATTGWDYDANIASGVKKLIAAYKNGGMLDAITTVDDCYKTIDKQSSDAQFKRLEFCAGMDLAAYRLDEAMAKTNGFPVTEYFTIDNVSARIGRINKYVTEPVMAKNIAGAWTISATQALNKYVNN